MPATTLDRTYDPLITTTRDSIKGDPLTRALIKARGKGRFKRKKKTTQLPEGK